jgi:hypothetical protein
METTAVRRTICSKLQTGILFRYMSWQAVQLREGAGEHCSACEEPICKPAWLVEYQSPQGAVIRFHEPCYSLWHEVCEEVG